MNRIALRPEAMVEMREAAAWYAELGLGLDTAFLDDVARVLDGVGRAPARYPLVDTDIRKAMLQRFPYLILFRAGADEVVVIACFHTRRDPKEWQKRL